MPPFNLGLWLVALLCAELSMILARTDEINIVFRSEKQRTAEEQKQIDRGLRKSVLLDILLFVPASVVLVLITWPLLWGMFRLLWGVFRLPIDGSSQISLYGLLGVASYRFPVAVIRRHVIRAALVALSQSAPITIPAAKDRVEGSLLTPGATDPQPERAK